MKKLLDSDWLRTVQFFLNTVQKRGNWMQKKGNKASILIGQWTKKFTDKFWSSLQKFTRAYLFQITLEIMWLPIQIALRIFSNRNVASAFCE